MTARRYLAVLALLVLPGIAGAQMCNGLAYFQPKSRQFFVGGEADLVKNANAFGGLFGIAGGGDKAMSFIANVRTIQFTGTSGLGFGFQFDKAFVAKPTYEFCGFVGADQVSVSSATSSAYQIGGSWGWMQSKGENKLGMLVRVGLNFGIPSVGSTTTDVFSEVGLGYTMANGFAIIPSWNQVFDGVSDGTIRIRATFPIGARKTQ